MHKSVLRALSVIWLFSPALAIAQITGLRSARDFAFYGRDVKDVRTEPR
jgi:hypothetical protein